MDRIQELLADYWLDWADRNAAEPSPELDARIIAAIAAQPAPSMTERGGDHNTYQ